MSKRAAATRLRILATVMEGALWDDEGMIMWVKELRVIANGLDPQASAAGGKP